MLQWKIFMVMALIGHILCGISDGFLTYAPNGKVDLTNFKDYEKSKVAFHGMPLKNRTNIVLTGNRDYQVKGAIVVHSMEELQEELKKYNSEQVYVIGGDSVYRQMLPYCDVAHVTKIDHEYEADAYFPNLDEMDEWYIAADSDEQTYFDLEYQFLMYKRKK